MLPLSDVQTALYAALTAAVAPVPVLDLAGPDERFPYFTMGEFTATPDDPVTPEQGVDIDMTLHVWSRQPGMQEIQRLMQTAKDSLHYKRFPVSGFQWVQTAWEFAQTMRDMDGVTRHGVMRFRVITFSLPPPVAPPPPVENGLAGTVNTFGSMSVVWVSGDTFVPAVAGRTITIAGADYGIFQYVSATQIFVDPAPSAATDAPYAINGDF